MLRSDYQVDMAEQWRAGSEAMMIALHARRSAPSVAAWRAVHPHRPLLLVLTGTDLYRDIHTDASAQRSLELADALVVLNELGAAQLPEKLHARSHVVLQSCPARTPQRQTSRHLRALMVGHLRDEKDPRTFWRTAQRLAGWPDIFLDHIGGELDPALGVEAAALAAKLSRFRWLGAQPHAKVRRRIADAHVLVHPSRMEGGANVVIEAIRCGTPVLASRIDGNLGLLGLDYEGVFDVGDDATLARLVERCRDDQPFLQRLKTQIALRAKLFEPAGERAVLLRLVGSMLVNSRSRKAASTF